MYMYMYISMSTCVYTHSTCVHAYREYNLAHCMMYSVWMYMYVWTAGVIKAWINVKNLCTSNALMHYVCMNMWHLSKRMLCPRFHQVRHTYIPYSLPSKLSGPLCQDFILPVRICGSPMEWQLLHDNIHIMWPALECLKRRCILTLRFTTRRQGYLAIQS